MVIMRNVIEDNYAGGDLTGQGRRNDNIEQLDINLLSKLVVTQNKLI